MRRRRVTGIAFGWFEPNDWLLIKKRAVDAAKQDDSYEEWKSNANKAIGELRAQGFNVTKIAIRAEEFLSWCDENNVENTGNTRSQFAAKKLQERSSET